MEEEIKTQKPLKKADYDNAVRTAKELLDKFNSEGKWTKEDKQNVEKLKAIVSVLAKLPVLKRKRKPRVKVFDRDKDLEIVRRFIVRVTNVRE